MYIYTVFSLKQTEDKAARVEDHLYEMSKPLSRAKDDEDLDAMLKNKERADDPMLAFIKKKTKDKAKKGNGILPYSTDQKKSKHSYVVQIQFFLCPCD